ncbi:aromatic ring-opening dioxygenase LigA [Mumia zhuanghuii]|uniref:Aromatic ring-opening dioxygenase LigA n=2 Tax=Mumia TaxID=1546255 RepID=A0ABW1QGG7_9ACTN|nr:MULTISPECIES: aromatic ring-opening dioxygenase LigA [Mumia]KAA1424836.1 aromatic ring-opening dioxygenase LigA [Mumia zhuanghuii]
MSTISESTDRRSAKGLGILIAIAGVVMVIAGATTYTLVSQTLADEKITVSDDARFAAGDDVNGPWSAYWQADIIQQHAEEAADGNTYAELEQDDPRREVVMDASFLRASLFTSVVAFGVSALVVGLGIVFLLVGWALVRLSPSRRAEPAPTVE